MKPIFSVVAAVIILLSINFVSAQIIASRAPQARIVTAEQLQALPAVSKNRGQFLIVDVRAKAETEVSIIPGAITKAEFERTQQDHHGKTIITYCTVGYRSGIYAQELKKKGWNVWNYQGSILDWCEHHLPVVTPSGQNTKRVHTFNSRYALAEGYQAIY